MAETGTLDKSRSGQVLLAAWSVAVLAFLTALIVAIVPLAFNAGDDLSFPLAGWSLRWFTEFFGSQTWRTTLFNSILTGSGATVVSGRARHLNQLRPSQRDGTRPGFGSGRCHAPLVGPTVIVGAGMYSSSRASI